MVEHAVKYHADVVRMAFLYKILKICVVSQPAVQTLVVCCFIAVPDGFKKRADVERVAADLFDVADPGECVAQAVQWSRVRVLLRCVAQS